MTGMATALLDRPLVAQVDALRHGEVAVADLVAAALDRAARLQERLNAFLSFDGEAALSRARALDRLPQARRDAMPLFGAPLAHKDMFAREGRRVTYASKLFAEHRPRVTATLIRRLDAAGAVDLGTLNMSEFACNPYGMNVLVGRARNPWNPDHIAGGSSSGSAAAVAARLIAASFGSDTGGSVRLPAAACGVFGLLPTNGRVSRHGMLPLSHSLDCAGPLARSARDLARVLGVVAGRDPEDASSSAEPVPDYEAGIEAGIAGMTIGFAANYYSDEIDADTEAMMDTVAAIFGEAAAKVSRIEVPDPRPLDALGNLLILAEAASYHLDDLRERGGEYTPLVRERIQFGFSFDAVSYIDALRLRAIELKRFLAAVFTRADVLVLPTLPHAAPAFADVERALAGAADLSFPLAKFTRSINYLGLPAVSVPAGLDRHGLPLAFQVVGRPFDEALILRVARGFEKARPPALPDTGEPR